MVDAGDADAAADGGNENVGDDVGCCYCCSGDFVYVQRINH